MKYLLFKGVPLLDVSLIGLTINEIEDITNRFNQPFIDINTFIHAYFRLAEQEFWRPENADLITTGQYALGAKLINWELSWNQVLQELPIREQNYIDIVGEMNYRMRFLTEFWIKIGVLRIPTVQDLIKQYELSVLGDSFENRQNDIISRTDRYLEIYISKLNRFWELQRKFELTIRMEQKYPPINTGINVVRIIEFNVITGDEIVELEDLKNFELNNAKNDYIREVNNEDRAHKEGVAFPDTPGIIPLQLTLLPIRPQPERPTTVILEIQAQDTYPPLTDRELSPKEHWNIRYGNVIKEQNDIGVEAANQIENIRNTYGTVECPRLPEEIFLLCEYWFDVQSIATQNLTLLIREVSFPEEPQERLISYPPRPTQDDIDAYLAQKEAERQAEEDARQRAILERELQDLFREIEAVRADYQQAVRSWVGWFKAFGTTDPETVNARNIKESLLNQLVSLMDEYETASGRLIKEQLRIPIDDFIALREDQRARGEQTGVFAFDGEIYTLRQIYRQRYAITDPETRVITFDDWYIERFGSS